MKTETLLAPRLHLGCGNRYLSGYVNIDYPPDETTIETDGRKVDIYSDIMTLKYKNSSVSEVRSHHVFEHFDRPTALALLAVWNRWLVMGGQLRIEVPDIQKTFLSFLFSFWSRRRRMVAIRHIFGSHEAHWAIHKEGWTKSTLIPALKAFGFEVAAIDKNSWRGTYNLEITATKVKELSMEEFMSAAKEVLSDYLLDLEQTESQILNLWLKAFGKIVSSFQSH